MLSSQIAILIVSFLSAINSASAAVVVPVWECTLHVEARSIDPHRYLNISGGGTFVRSAFTHDGAKGLVISACADWAHHFHVDGDDDRLCRDYIESNPRVLSCSEGRGVVRE